MKIGPHAKSDTFTWQSFVYFELVLLSKKNKIKIQTSKTIAKI